jgi:uncharacterized protein (UPF0333 family)
MAILKVFSLISILAAVVIGAYIYVSHINGSTTPIDPTTSSSPSNSAAGAVNNFNEQSQQQLQNAQSQYGQ